MTTLNIHNVPDELVERLRRRAEAAGSSVEIEAVRCLEASIGDDPAFDHAQQLRDALRGQLFVTEAELKAAKGEGRE